jgi:D-threo-aldose 1-dehydrogenase
LSFGAAQIGNLHRVVSDDDARGTIDAAWDVGLRYFDVAPHYGLGLAERRLGEALGGRPRDDYIVSTKVGRLLVLADPATTTPDPEGFAVPRTHVRVRDYSRDGVMRSLESSLERLGLERVDLVLVHDPDEYGRDAIDGAFPLLDELRSQGVIRSYGAGMNQSAMLASFVRNTDLDVVLIAGRYTLLEQDALDDLLPACQNRGVSVVLGGVFNSGLLATERPTDDARYDYAVAPRDLVVRANRIADICERHGTTLPEAAVQFVFGHPSVATVCIGARSPAQVLRNATLFERRIGRDFWMELMSEGLLRADAPLPSAAG